MKEYVGMCFIAFVVVKQQNKIKNKDRSFQLNIYDAI
jgi:hypothetical protein